MIRNFIFKRTGVFLTIAFNITSNSCSCFVLSSHKHFKWLRIIIYICLEKIVLFYLFRYFFLFPRPPPEIVVPDLFSPSDLERRIWLFTALLILWRGNYSLVVLQKMLFLSSLKREKRNMLCFAPLVVSPSSH